MKNFDRFQNVMSYYLKSISASIDLLKLKSNEVSGAKHKELDKDIKALEKHLDRVIDKLDKFFNADPDLLVEVERELEEIYEDAKNSTRQAMSR